MATFVAFCLLAAVILVFAGAAVFARTWLEIHKEERDN